MDRNIGILKGTKSHVSNFCAACRNTHDQSEPGIALPRSRHHALRLLTERGIDAETIDLRDLGHVPMAGSAEAWDHTRSGPPESETERGDTHIICRPIYNFAPARLPRI